MPEIRDKNFTLRLSESEYNYLKQQAEKNYMPVAVFIRQKVLVGMSNEQNGQNKTITSPAEQV